MIITKVNCWWRLDINDDSVVVGMYFTDLFTVTAMQTNSPAKAARRKAYELGINHPAIWKFIVGIRKI